MKHLDQEAVKKAAEFLMDQNGSTTTLDVKNHLRAEGYTAFQADVSQFMSMLVNIEQWQFEQKGRYRSYKFGADTQESLLAYMEKGDEFWEIRVEDKQMMTASGKVGTSGGSDVQDFSRNRKAMEQAEALIAIKKQLGFTEAQDERLALHIRQKYEPYMYLKPLSCRIGYYDLKKIDKQSIRLSNSVNNALAYLELTKNVGCYCTWKQSPQLKSIVNLLENDAYNALDLAYDHIELLGEKLMHKSLHDPQGQSLDSNQPYQAENAPEIKSLELKREHIFQITFYFENQVKIVLSKFDLHLTKELIPMAAKILKNID